MTDLPEIPLVTFALFTYNQEKYIREAVEGALAQDYPNLEIIISDDCSTDGTIEQASAAIADYSGPHRVVIRKTKSNLGTFQHVLDVTSISSGKLLVLAAGDDVSKTNRVSRLAAAWDAEGAWGLCSRYDLIDSDGKNIKSNTRTEELFSPEFDLRLYFKDSHGVGIVHGATSAYSAELFKRVQSSDVPWILSEDGILSLLINLLGKKVVHVDESLVHYRLHHEALTNSPDVPFGKKPLKSFFRKRAAYDLSSKNRAMFFLAFAEDCGNEVQREINHSFVNSSISRHGFQSSWLEVGFWRRFVYTVRNPGDWRWNIPRLLGENIYIAVKMFRDRFRKS